MYEGYEEAFRTFRMIEKPTAQQVFDFIVTHLSRQGGRSADEDTCYYRDMDKDRRCAIGAIMPDSVYREDYEGNGISLLLCLLIGVKGDLDHEWFKLICVNHEQLLGRLQAAHDLIGHPDEPDFILTGRLKHIAERFGLDSSIVDTLTWPDIWE